mmetsp:Transcript_5938/g.8985  ORF Transcript_5938/g.8985 Transcript_5938/m.8985 type:complete len:91 (+) Transcript_5938:105-377(+)
MRVGNGYDRLGYTIHLLRQVVNQKLKHSWSKKDLSSLVVSTPLHPLKPLAHACLLHLSLDLLLGVFEVPAVTKLHHMSGLVYLTLETAKS